MSDTDSYPLGNSNSSFDVGPDILNWLFLYDFFYIFPCIVNLSFDKVSYLPFCVYFVSKIE